LPTYISIDSHSVSRATNGGTHEGDQAMPEKVHSTFLTNLLGDGNVLDKVPPS